MFSIFEPEDYKGRVLEIIWDGKRITRIVCELRMILFIKATSVSKHRPQALMPFPSCFFDPATKVKKFDLLRETLGLLPPFVEIKEETILPPKCWELLHWVFTNPLTIEAITDNFDQQIAALKEATKLSDIPKIFHMHEENPYASNEISFGKKMPSNSVFVFKMTPSIPKNKFEEGKAAHGSFFAYHGSQLENFHSIIHRGLKAELNVRKAYGHGTYLSSRISISKNYSMKGSYSILDPRASGDALSNFLWNAAEKLVCVAIVEVVDHPELKKVDVRSIGDPGDKYFVAENDEWLQLSHLIVFANSLVR